MSKTITSLIGDTPLLKLNLGRDSADLYLKLESFNPGGSVKDRVALAMVEAATAAGQINQATVILEATSGNTGIGLSLVAASQGIPLVLVMPDNMSVERQKLLRAYGARIILTPGELGMAGAVKEAQALLAADSRYLHLDQFANPANPRCHYNTTGPEIYRSLAGSVDALVVGVGTGGTLTGTGSYLKERCPDLQIIAVEPAQSPVLSGGKGGSHPIQGIGAGFIPPVLDRSLIDAIVGVSGEEAFATARELARRNGLLVGISAGAAVWAARGLAAKLGPGRRVVAIAPDSGERYLSTALYV